MTSVYCFFKCIRANAFGKEKKFLQNLSIFLIRSIFLHVKTAVTINVYSHIFFDLCNNTLNAFMWYKNLKYITSSISSYSRNIVVFLLSRLKKIIWRFVYITPYTVQIIYQLCKNHSTWMEKCIYRLYYTNYITRRLYNNI